MRKQNKPCRTCGATTIHVVDPQTGDWYEDPFGYPALFCPRCSDHPVVVDVGPKSYSDLYKTCFCCERDRKRTENHHISYHPEVVKPVCKGCHERIHHEEGFRPDLAPDLTREEAIEKGHITPGFSEATPNDP